jgi:hypothetical protein
MNFEVFVLEPNLQDVLVGPCLTTFKRTGSLAPEPPMKVLVIGATGGCGQHAFKACCDLSIDVRAMARDEAKARRILGGEARIVKGDLLDAKSLYVAMEDVNALIIAIGKARGEAGATCKTVDYEGVCNIIAAAKRRSIRKIVHVTSYGIDSPERTFICFLNHMTGLTLGWKLRAEQALRESGIPYVVVRPTGLKDKSDTDLAPVIKQCKPYEWGMCRIAREVVGLICAQALLHSPGFVTLDCREDPQKRRNGIGSFDWQGAFARLQKDGPLPFGFDDHEAATKSFAKKLIIAKWTFRLSLLYCLARFFRRLSARAAVKG